jgi:hypothetical protein
MQFGHIRFFVQPQSSKLQHPSSKEQRGRLLFDVWCFSGAWCLVFGAFGQFLGALLPASG